MPRNLIVASVALALLSCAGPRKSDGPPISVLQRIYATPVVVYLLDNEEIDTAMVVQKAATMLADFKLTSDLPDSITFDGFRFELTGIGDEAFIQPDLSIIAEQFFDITPDEKNSFGISSRALSFWFFGLSDKVTVKNGKINAFIGEITAGKRVVIMDVATFQFYNNSSWKKNRVEPFSKDPVHISTQVTIHTYREGEYCRAVSLGMMKFSLPEISVRNFPCSNEGAFGDLVNITMQTLLESPYVSPDTVLAIDIKKLKNADMREGFIATSDGNLELKGEVKLRTVMPEEGDNYAIQFAVTFDDRNYSSPLEEANVLLTKLFGSSDDIASFEHDEEILAARDRARTKLPSLRKSFNEGLPAGEALMLKAPFKTPDGRNEWMWVEVTVWTESKMEGILQNEPFEVPGLKSGALVEIREEEIFDYILLKADGSTEGNETGEIMESRQSKQ